MTTPFVALPLSAPLPGKVKIKRVLLGDSSGTKRHLRAGTRDMETRELNRAATESRTSESRTLDDLLREEMQ